MREILTDLDADKSDPVRMAQQAMRAPLPKRFYENALAAEHEGGFAVFLDGKLLRTPARNVLRTPTLKAAQLVASEFAKQVKEIDPAKMPVTRLANSIIDGISADRQSVANDIISFAGSDLVCYRAGAPRELVALQIEYWDAVTAHFRDRHGANFVLAEGVMHVEQPPEALLIFAALIRRYDDAFALGCLHSMTTLTGSALVPIALAEGLFDAQTAWNTARIDEEWSRRQWGEDAEAEAREAFRKRDFLAAAELMAACKAQ